MKKLIIVLSCVLCFTWLCSTDKSFALDIEKHYNERRYELPENSKEIIYRDMSISLLIPYIQKEINNYYKDYLTELPIVFPYSVEIVSAKRESGYLIELELIVHPFVGPINIVGDDRIIIETGAFGSVKVIKFEHIKSYQLPWNWQHIIKKVY